MCVISHRVASVLAELHVDLEVDDGGVTELEGVEGSVEGPALVLGQPGEDGVGGAAALVQQLDLLVVQAGLGDQVSREDVEDGVAVQLDPEE